MPDSKIVYQDSRRWWALGWRVSGRLLGIGAMLLALEAPSLAQLAPKPLPTEPLPTEQTEQGDDIIPLDADLTPETGPEPGAAEIESASEASHDDGRTEAPSEAIGEAATDAIEGIGDDGVTEAPSEAIGGEISDEAREDSEGGAEEAAIAEPIPTLAERCAAPEASLFPAPLPEAEEAVSDEAVSDETAPGEAVSDEAVSGEAVSGETAPDEAVSSETAPDEAAIAPPAPEQPSADEVAIVEPDTALEDLDREAEAEAAAKAAAEKQRVCQLLSADQQYRAGDLEDARRQYQAAKPDFDPAARDLALPQRPAALNDPEQLSPAGQVFLREAAAGQAKNLETGILIPLELLVQRHPEYVPGQLQLSQSLVTAGRGEEGLAVLAAATRDYPREPALVKAHIALAAQQEQWMDAVMLARQFAQLNPDHPEAPDFDILADENMARFQDDVRDRLRANTIANVLTGAVSVALTGSIWNSLSAIQTTATMLRGEEGVGSGISNSIKRQVELVEDEEIVTYINDMGQKLAAVAGRDEFDYEFNVLMDPNINAFALPGGKIFVNAGAIAQTQSEAELAGLLSHELAHAVLSHGFQLVSDGSLLSDVSRFIPYGGFASNLIVLNYSRDMERQADELGTRILAASGYAADGLHGLMKTLGEATEGRQPLFAWLSTHPETDERVKNIEAQIAQEGLDPYRFEGVEQHFRMRVKVKRLIEEWQERKAKEAKERPWWR